jgi:hypothetical protein
MIDGQHDAKFPHSGHTEILAGLRTGGESMPE